MYTGEQGHGMSRHITRMTIADAGHIAPAQRAVIEASYPAHERAARARGEPQLGSGRVFAYDESLLAVRAFAVPLAWRQIGGLDFGWDHPTAAVHLAWDPAGTAYVVDAYRQREKTPRQHAERLGRWGSGAAARTSLRWAWPADGLQHDKGSGAMLHDAWRAAGLRLLPKHATLPSGGTGVEAAAIQMLEAMVLGRFKVFEHLEDWFGEYRLYHRKDGVIVREADDLMAATRYAFIMAREARSLEPPPHDRHRRAADTDFDPGRFGG